MSVKPFAVTPLAVSSSAFPAAQSTVAYPGQYLSLQQNLPPLAQKRSLTTEETALLGKGLNQWTGKWFPHLGSELWELMSSPRKQALLWGHVSGWASSIAAGAFAHHVAPQWDNVPSALLGLGVGTLIGLPFAWFSREAAQQNNGNLLDMWKRLPERPTYRDYLTDSVASQVAPRQIADAKQVGRSVLSTAAKVATLGAVAAASQPRGFRHRSGKNFNFSLPIQPLTT